MDDNLFSVFYLKNENKFLYCHKPRKAFLYYKNFKINLLTGEKFDWPIDRFLSELDKIKLSDNFESPQVFHLFYELGYLIQKRKDLIPEYEPLAVSFDYIKSEIISPKEISNSNQLELVQYPRLKKYKKTFHSIREHLLSGDCYQVNLTHPFYFRPVQKMDQSDYLDLFLSGGSGLGSYAHFTSIGVLDKILISNSPECLFKAYNKNENLMIRSMPIKGTAQDNGEGSWLGLKKSLKDQGELYMISDLVRNDLARIDLTPAKILYKKMPLKVPGIIHQFSVVETKVSKNVTLKKVLDGLFPGGSITGAPKKRVMEIIKKNEGYHRGLYCGSTVILHKTMKCASINIRSAEVSVDTGEIKYGSGGGITLLSKNTDEFDESYQKMKSFLKFLKADLVNKS